jgi:pimeloyl-ACP methyl ester carboxylesterase
MKDYDEFGLFADNASEVGLPYDGPPAVKRVDVPVDEGGRVVSALVWGDAPPEIVLIHGGAQNAHTWDTVALALRRPLVALDLPGHGHSGWRDDMDYRPPSLADDVAVAIRELAPDAVGVVGMSLGGMTTFSLASRHPDLVRAQVIVDVTPGVNQDKAKAIIDFIRGPQSFPSFDEILERTITFNPTRTESSLRRGVLHNAFELEDGTWQWRYDRRHHEAGEGGDLLPDPARLWEDVSAAKVPLLLLRGGLSPVVDDDDVAELLRRRPDAHVVVVENAGHSIQGDQPLELARLLEEFLDLRSPA